MGWRHQLYLDLLSHRVIGLVASGRIKKNLPIRALDMAMYLRKPPSACIFHSVCGSQHCSHVFQKKLLEYKTTPSMSGQINRSNKAVVEIFFKKPEGQNALETNLANMGSGNSAHLSIYQRFLSTQVPFLYWEYQSPRFQGKIRLERDHTRAQNRHKSTSQSHTLLPW